jgi:mRNA-degrading endonuclease RelE of RelBE toxin-antitoxin system
LDQRIINIYNLDKYTPLAYKQNTMQIIETSIFTRRVVELLSDDDYRELQSMLVIRPDAGPVIPGSGGLRKLRWAASGRGKRGGARIIYYWFTSQEKLLMLYIYPKNEQDNLTPDQLKALKKIVEREYP